MARLQNEYIKTIKPNLMKDLGLKNIFSVPEIKKVVINIGVLRCPLLLPTPSILQNEIV